MFLFHHPLIPGDRWVLTSMNRTWLIGWGEGTLIKTRWKPLTPRLLWAEWRCLTFFSKICFCQTWGSLLFLLVTILIECLVYSCEEASHQLARKSAEDEQTATSSSSLPCCQRNGDEESRASRLLSSTAPGFGRRAPLFRGCSHLYSLTLGYCSANIRHQLFFVCLFLDVTLLIHNLHFSEFWILYLEGHMLVPFLSWIKLSLCLTAFSMIPKATKKGRAPDETRHSVRKLSSTLAMDMWNLLLFSGCLDTGSLSCAHLDS